MKLDLRDSTPHDTAFVYQLRNDIETRKWTVREDVGKKTFLSDPNPVSVDHIHNMNALIFTLDAMPIGYGTITERGSKVVLTWHVALPFRNRGYGRELIKLLLLRADGKTPLAFIKRDDLASQRAALAAGMVDQTERDEGKTYPVETWGLDQSPEKAV